MIKNYFKIAWRNLLKHKGYAAIKIIGFAIGIASCLLIAFFVIHQISFDQSYPNKNQIYRIVGSGEDNTGKLSQGTSFPAPTARAFKEDFPEIEESGRLLPNTLFGAGSNQISTDYGEESFHEEGITFADQEFFNILQLPIIEGNIQHLLDAPNTIVITKGKADKYFPDGHALGKQIYLNNDKQHPYKISGVIADIPPNSHLYPYSFFLTIEGIRTYEGEQSNWLASNYTTYIKLKEHTNISPLQDKLTKTYIEKYWSPAMLAAGLRIPDRVNNMKISLQPIENIHLYSEGIHDYGSAYRGDIRFVWLFSGIALFILLLAGINFVNLSTARSAERAKEVGLRKVVGSKKNMLVFQFLTESTLYCFISVVLGVIVAWLCLPLFNNLSGLLLVFPWRSVWFLSSLIILVIFLGVLAGLYPAMYLASFKPIQILKGTFSKSSKTPNLRNGLVVFQFTVSIILISCTLIIYGQMQFILTKKVGFDKEQVMVIQGTNTLGSGSQTLKNELLKIAGVSDVTIGDYMPVKIDGVKRNGNTLWKEGRVNIDPSTQGQLWEIDENYITTLGIKLVEGRNFNTDISSDSEAAIINQSLAKSFHLESPIGAIITNGWKKMTIIGIVEDFHFEPMKQQVGGLCLVLGNSPSMMAAKLKTADISGTISAIEKKWKEVSPHQTIRYSFLDDSFAGMYKNVQQTRNIFTSFAVLTIFIACLGLFGLAAFTTEQRTKEIGVRKVLGASVTSIVHLLSNNFIKLVSLSILIAVPLAWWIMNKWLQDFAYKIDIEWWMFVIAGIIAIVIALLTVSYQAIKAALSNPVDSLRNE